MGQKAFRMMDRMRILLGMLVISSFISIATTSTTAPVAGENATIEYQSMPDESEGSGYVRDTPAPAAAPDSDASDAWQDKSEAISCDSYDAQSCCSKEINKVSDETISIPTKQKSDLPSFTFVTVESSDVSICKKDAKGKDFRGTLSKTKSGKTCQAWGVQTPHEHSRRPTDYPDAGLESNYCRNPDNEAAPWCYTTDSNTRWEYCFIPTCPTTRKVLTFVGQTIYMSQIYNILKDGQYQPSSPMDRKLQYNVNIQSDAFYCDERQKRSDETSQANLREYKIPGLLKFVLTARSIESDNCVLNFNHDGITMKEEFPAQPTKNGENGKSFGANGKNGEDGSVGVNGYDGTEVNIAYLSAKGRLRIQTKGVQGAKGGNGANGGAGFKGKDGSCSYKCKDTQKCYTGYGTYCEDRSSKNCKTEHHNKVAPGTAGNGGKAGAKGKPGNGGAAGTVNLYLKDVSNTGFKLTLSGCKGSVGPNTASDGQGGNGGASGGPGRTRGCAWYKKYRRTGGGWGAAPYDWLCTDRSDKNCPQSRGASGTKGAVKTALQGSVGAKLQGIMTSSKLRFRAYFDDVVQQMVIQHAEDLFIQGKKDEAKEILETALQLMTSANQANIDYCNTLIQFITSGLNYFGYKENQFSAIGWTTTRDEVTALIQTANTQAANINNILKYIATKDVLKSNRDLFATSMLAPAQSELLETGRRILFEQNLKKKAIEIMGEMEDHMDVLADKMKQDLEKAVNRRKVKFALELVQLGLSLFAGFLSFKSARKSKDKFGAAGAILGGAEQIMTYVTDQSLRASKGRMCNTKYGEMKDFAEKMMKMSVYIPTDPLQTSFLNIDSVAKAELLKVQALEKRDDLLLGFKCLIEFVGYPGDVLEGTIGAYFDYSFARLNVMGQAIQHDINIKQLQFKKERIEATIKSLTEATKESNLGTYNPAMEKARLLFKEKMVEVFRGIEKDALRGLYKKSIAFQFITLWDPKLTDAIKLAKSSQRTAVGDVFFTGNLYLQELDNKLKNMECKLRNCMAQSDRYVIRHNAYMWIFTPARQKKLFEGIWTAGIGSFTLTNEGICSNNAECINLRLKKMYVEVRGDGLFKDQNIVRVEVSHSGQNLFYMPSDGATTATYTQTKKKLVHINVDKTKLTTTTCSNDRWYCNAAFPSNGNGRDMCTLAEQAPIEQLYGTEPCRSLFSQYTVNLPKTDTEHGSITKNSNLLDWTKVQSIKVFATVRAFKNYPTESDCAGAGGCGSNKKLKKEKKAKKARKFKKSE